MRVTTMVERSWVNCDGCDYTIGRTQAMVEAGVTLEQLTATLRIPWPHSDDDDGFVTFHFHGPHQDGDRHDCLRYWAHDTHVMQRSLTNRGWDQAQIDEFMAIHLYRPKSADWGTPSRIVVVQG